MNAHHSNCWFRAGVAGMLCALLSATDGRGVDWVELGPAPVTNGDYTGRVAALACSPVDANVYFAGGADGGVWRTTDGGLTWTPLTDDLPSSAIGALAIDPTDADVVYAGTGEANFANHSRPGEGLYRSLDGGDTWEILGADTFAGRCFAKLVLNPQDTQILYAAITRAGGFPELAAAKGHPGATGPVGLFRSTDGGVNWEHLTGGLPALSATDVAIDPANPQIVYAAIGRIFGSTENGVYRSTDGGDSWSKLGGGLPTGSLGRISIAVAPSMPQRVYALVTNPASSAGGNATTRGAYRSDDGGDTWTSIPVGSLQSTYGWYLSFVSVQPTNADTVFMGGLTLRRSTNAGGSWSTVTPPHVDMHAAAWDAAGRLVVGDDGGVHRSSTLGSNWSALNDGLGLVQFYAGLSSHPADPLFLVGGTQDNGSNRRSTDSREWTQILGGDGGWTQIIQAFPERIFTEYQGTGNLYYSENGGGSFVWRGNGIDSSDRNCFLPPYVTDPTLPNRMYYGTHRVWRTSNGGSFWGALSGDLTDGAGAIRTLAIAPTDPQVLYAATNDGNVLVSTDGGFNFTLILDNVPGWPRTTREIFVDPTDAGTMYLGVGYYDEARLRRTRDYGQSWEVLDAALPDLPVNTVGVDVRGRKPAIYAGTEDGLYRSVNDGLSWHRYGAGLPRTAVIDVLLEPERGRLIAATQGRGAWQIAVAVPGDLDGDGQLNNADIAAFVLALTDRAAFAAQYPGVDADLAGDLDGDGALSNGDIAEFVALLAG